MRAYGTIRYLCRATFALIAVLAAGTPAYGQICTPGYPAEIRAYDSRELALLPNYCIYTQHYRDHVPGGNDKAKIDYWYSMMGKSLVDVPIFHTMHHYCWGLMKTNRAVLQACTPTIRTFWLKDSIGEFNFVIEKAPEDFVLLPEILTKKGENLLRLGLAPAGLKELMRAIELKPDYWPPYADISDYYKGSGNLQSAREFLEKGLSLSPGATALKRRLAELDAAKDTRKPPPQQAKGK